MLHNDTVLVTGLSVRREVARKALHLLFVIVPVSYAAGLPRIPLVIMLATAAVLALVVEVARAWHPATRERFGRAVGMLLREHEQARWSGATWLVLAMLGLAALAPPDVAIAGMWTVSAGDAAAALVGRALGRRGGPGGGTGKTVRGSAACFVVSLCGALALAHLSLVEGVLAASLATAAERPSGWMDDNARIAIAVAGGILLWRMMFS